MSIPEQGRGPKPGEPGSVFSTDPIPDEDVERAAQLARERGWDARLASEDARLASELLAALAEAVSALARAEEANESLKKTNRALQRSAIANRDGRWAAEEQVAALRAALGRIAKLTQGATPATDEGRYIGRINRLARAALSPGGEAEEPSS